LSDKALVIALSGQGNGTVGISNGQVTIDLRPFINTVKQDLVKHGFTLASSAGGMSPQVSNSRRWLNQSEG
jgi:hypothetical protein